ncbi:MAG: uracil-DNA glycosylase, partial [Fuerstiella sp.]
IADFSKTVQPLAQQAEVRAVLESQPATVEAKGQGLQQIAGLVSKCDRCTELAMNRRQTVFGSGNPDAKIMFIGEAPGADEDRLGEPFVGAAGQLLDKIIVACGLKREDLYICNILRCRPPGNRSPLPQEAENCREYLDAQIAIVQPDYIVCWGTIAAQNLLNEKNTVAKLRGTWLKHGTAKVLCTYHPSYLLRYPQQKKEVWGDMKLLMADMGVEL